jgi:hypothetical protein
MMKPRLRLMQAGEIRHKGDEYSWKDGWHPVEATLGLSILPRDVGKFRTRRKKPRAFRK